MTRYFCSCCGLERDDRRDDRACWLPGCPGVMIETTARNDIDTMPIPRVCPHGESYFLKPDCQACAMFEYTRAALTVSIIVNLVTCGLVLLVLTRVSP